MRRATIASVRINKSPIAIDLIEPVEFAIDDDNKIIGIIPILKYQGINVDEEDLIEPYEVISQCLNVCDTPEFKERIKDSEGFIKTAKILQGTKLDDITVIKAEKIKSVGNEFIISNRRMFEKADVEAAIEPPVEFAIGDMVALVESPSHYLGIVVEVGIEDLVVEVGIEDLSVRVDANSSGIMACGIYRLKKSGLVPYVPPPDPPLMRIKTDLITVSSSEIQAIKSRLKKAQKSLKKALKAVKEFRK